MAPRVFWIGLGNMGRGMCKNLVEKGNLDQPLMIYNRSKQRATDLSSKLPAGKTEVVDSVEAGVAKADVIFTCVANDVAVQDTHTAALKGDIKGKLFIDCSTIHPDTTEVLAKGVLAHGAEFVAAPVMGAPAAADAGQLIALLAGPTASVERARPYFKGVMARAEVDLTDQPCQKASMLKVISNTFILNMVEQLSEGYVLAEKTGLGTNYLQQVIDALFGGVYSGYSKRMLEGDYHKREEPLFAVDLARKDAGHAMKLAEQAGVKLHNVETGDAHLVRLKEHVGESGDIAGVYGAVRLENGLNYENNA